MKTQDTLIHRRVQQKQYEHNPLRQRDPLRCWREHSRTIKLAGTSDRLDDLGGLRAASRTKRLCGPVLGFPMIHHSYLVSREASGQSLSCVQS